MAAALLALVNGPACVSKKSADHPRTVSIISTFGPNKLGQDILLILLLVSQLGTYLPVTIIKPNNRIYGFIQLVFWSRCVASFIPVCR